MKGMKLLGAVLVPLTLLALACGETGNLQTPLPPALLATIQAVAAETQAANESPSDPDQEATITARVQATVRALINATPIPSPTPTGGFSTPTVEPTSFTTRTGSNFSTVPAPTATRVPTPTPVRLGPCTAAADGAVVTAWVNGGLAASTLVSSGSYSLLVEQASDKSFVGQTITFKVDGSDAKQTVFWTAGGATTLVLSAPGPGLGYVAPDSQDRPGLSGGPMAQPLPPHFVLGTVFVGAC